MAEMNLQVNEETIKARQVCAPATGVIMGNIPFQTSDRRSILCCGRRVFIEILNGDDEHYTEMAGDVLTKMMEDKFTVKPQSYYRDLTKKRLG